MKKQSAEILYDVVIGNGKIVDVEAEKFVKANIGILGDKIAIVTKEPLRGKRYENAEGKVVSPGFIDFHSHVDGAPFSAECLVRQGGTSTLGGERSLSSERIKKIAKEGFIVNQGFSISESFVLRDGVGIWDFNRAATPSEILGMQSMARSFMDYGAFGISFALELIPGTSFEELKAMALVAKEYDRPILIHMRKDGAEALDYFDELIRLARETDVKMHLLQLMYEVGIGGAMPKALEYIDAAREEGLDITADSGVYAAYCTSIGTAVFNEGWEDAYGDDISEEDLMVASGIHAGEWCTKELFVDLRKNHPQTLVSAFVCDVDSIPLALKKPYVYVSTNAADGAHYPGIGAPEVSGAYPRLIHKYVRQERTLTLMDAIRKVTILPAQRFGIAGRGIIKEGYQADITIFDEDRLQDHAEHMGIGNPNLPPSGIEAVYVNGKCVVLHGELTANRTAGILLTR